MLQSSPPFVRCCHSPFSSLLCQFQTVFGVQFRQFADDFHSLLLPMMKKLVYHSRLLFSALGLAKIVLVKSLLVFQSIVR